MIDPALGAGPTPAGGGASVEPCAYPRRGGGSARWGRMRTHALVLAGGSGDRFGADMPKQFIRLAGEPILLRSVRAIAAAEVDQLIVVSHPSWVSETREVLDQGLPSRPVVIVTGGATRNESTRLG